MQITNTQFFSIMQHLRIDLNYEGTILNVFYSVNPIEQTCTLHLLVCQVQVIFIRSDPIVGVCTKSIKPTKPLPFIPRPSSIAGQFSSSLITFINSQPNSTCILNHVIFLFKTQNTQHNDIDCYHIYILYNLLLFYILGYKS